MQALDKKWTNFRHTWNHTLSRRIVEIAASNHCEGIRLEDLRGAFTDTRTFLGRNWPLHELWQMITYKAEEQGMKVEFINPAYTSRRCHKCGHVEEGFSFDYRKKHNFPLFKCSACGWEGDADLNAAKNIANPEAKEEIKKARLAQILEKSGVFA
jgi:IS605 OrfB family transposase